MYHNPITGKTAKTKEEALELEPVAPKKATVVAPKKAVKAD